jgi:phage tail protein X
MSAVTLTSKGNRTTYLTSQGEVWDMIAYKVYGDEHAMSMIQDANFAFRFTDTFLAGVVLTIPLQVTVAINLKGGGKISNLSSLLPWRS